jgi:hypothetical protein
MISLGAAIYLLLIRVFQFIENNAGYLRKPYKGVSTA